MEVPAPFACQRKLQGWDVQAAHPELFPGSWPFQEWKQDAPLSASVHDIWCRPHERDPYLAPEIQLLYKAKGLRPKDEADFTRTFPALDGKSRQWLAQSLALVHPGHTWLTNLT